jgi:hypothetical protein
MWRIAKDGSALVRFRNLPTAVSYLVPDRFFAPEKRMQTAKEVIELPDGAETFVPGTVGKGLHLAAGRKLRFARGEKMPDGSFQNFPLHKGTIEFFFRPNWSALDVVNSGKQRPITRPLLSAGDMVVDYQYGAANYRNKYGSLRILCGKIDKTTRGRPRFSYGNNAQVFLNAGQWVHVAATWDIDFARTDYPVFHQHCHVFVNGRKHRRGAGGPPDLRFPGNRVENYLLEAIPEWITIGPADGTFDEVRVSDVVRYTEHFEPPAEPLAWDEHTRALIHFEGPLEVLGGPGKKVEAVLE